ncbi:DUF6343 family protein [Streptomyces sp. NPDC013313]|uniref:DUF6343 family protein n=1 Tax=Streptomyces sp. NPDC013313 TaxID=3155603 RepID=UPI0033C721DC
MRDNDQAGDGRPARPAPPDTRPGPGTPTRGSSRTGTEPVTARSPLRLRRPLSAVFRPLLAAATAALAIRAAPTGPGDSPGSGAPTVLAVIRGVLTLAAAPDLAAVTRRLRPGARREVPAPDEGFRRPAGPLQRLTDLIPASS